MSFFVTSWTTEHQAPLSFTISWSLLKFMSIESVRPSNHHILCHSLLLLPSIFQSIRVFSDELALCIRWPKYWSFSFSISLSDKYSELISFRTDWFDLLAVQGTLKSLLQHHSSKASILLCSAFFMVQLWYPYTATGKTIALTIRTQSMTISPGNQALNFLIFDKGAKTVQWRKDSISISGSGTTVHPWARKWPSTLVKARVFGRGQGPFTGELTGNRRQPCHEVWGRELVKPGERSADTLKLESLGQGFKGLPFSLWKRTQTP